jgi:hypothetical protein
MDEKYHVEVTSRDSAGVEDIPLTPPADDKGTRRLIRPQIVNNAHEAEASVQVTLMHQKRHKRNEEWEDAESFSLASLKAGQEVRFQLDTAETWRLKEALNQLFAIGQNGVPPQSMDFVAVPAKQIANSILLRGEPLDILEQMEEHFGARLWQALSEIKSDAVDALVTQRVKEKRARAVRTFRKVLEEGSAKEAHWKRFFSENSWIFGEGLRYQLLDSVQEGGGETLAGAKNYTVVVEVMTPQVPLMQNEPGRGQVHSVSPEVMSGVAALQPFRRAILLVGDTAQLDSEAKRNSFRAFRRNLRSPDVLTFDELLARAEFVFGHPG